jgi:hypothetical protein
MSQRKYLLSIDYHTDDETGMYEIGEIDFGISGNLYEYINQYGLQGKDNIIKMLATLIFQVEAIYRESNPQQVGQCANDKHKSEVL